MDFRWYHVPLLALGYIVEVVVGIYKRDVHMDFRDWIKFLYCVLLVFVPIVLVIWFLWCLPTKPLF
ncbi:MULTISPECIES: hypothetical protein [Bacillales]|uniref:hypothetical protein n=1 Tax=Bacillales TaxID=1385 RepID=UPI00126891EA|nr:MULTISPECIES: hypothetical protein [Bacillales]